MSSKSFNKTFKGFGKALNPIHVAKQTHKTGMKLAQGKVQGAFRETRRGSAGYQGLKTGEASTRHITNKIADNPALGAAATGIATVINPAIGAGVGAYVGHRQAKLAKGRAKAAEDEFNSALTGIGDDISGSIDAANDAGPQISFRSSLIEQRRRKGRRASVLRGGRSQGLTTSAAPSSAGGGAVVLG